MDLKDLGRSLLPEGAEEPPPAPLPPPSAETQLRAARERCAKLEDELAVSRAAQLRAEQAAQQADVRANRADRRAVEVSWHVCVEGDLFWAHGEGVRGPDVWSWCAC